MPSELSFHYIVTSATSVIDELILNNILNSASREWFVIVKRKTILQLIHTKKMRS